MTGGERQTKLLKKLLDRTREGRVQDWPERIAEIIRQVGYPLETICWQGSPEEIAFYALCKMYAQNLKEFEALEKALT